MKIFKEEQRFTQTWLITLTVISAFVPLTIIIKEYVDEKLPLSSLIIVTVIVLSCSSLIFFFKLKTRIDELGIYYQFFPFHFKLKKIGWNEITSANIRKYDALSEYGGWGLKSVALWNPSKGKAVNVAGNIGIQLVLKNGEKLLVGTQKEDEAKQVLETYQHKTD